MKIKSTVFVQSAATPAQFPKSELREVAFVGRSNVGKSTLINAILNRKKLVKTSSSPGKTRMINFFLINDRFHFVDLPGFGFAKVPKSMRDSWKRLIETYLKSRKNLAGVILLIDARRTPSENDKLMIDWLKYYDVQYVIVATKSDKISGNQLSRNLKRSKEVLNTKNILPFSAITKRGDKDLWNVIDSFLKSHSDNDLD